MAQFVHALEGMGDACRALDFPIVSGNVSLYNESKATGGGSAILPTPAIGGVGIIDDYSKMMTMGFKNEDHAIIVLGARPLGDLDKDETLGELGQEIGQSLWLKEIVGEEAGAAPTVDLAAERKIGEFVQQLITTGSVSAVHDISDGGAAIAIAEMALAGNIGADILTMGQTIKDAFSEDQSRYIVTCPWYDRDKWNAFEELAKQADITAAWIGGTGGDSISWTDGEDTPVMSVPLTDLREAHASFFRDWMET